MVYKHAMDAATKKLIAALLDLSAESFSNHGCNDFNLITLAGLSPDEAKEVQKLVRASMHPSDQDCINLDSPIAVDWVLMRVLATELRKA